MAFSSWQAFVDMGGYGGYVWSAYGLSAVILAAVVAAAYYRHGQLKRHFNQSNR